MSTTPTGLGELHRIHEQLRDLRQRQEKGGANEADVARLEVELRDAEQQLPNNIRHAYERSVESKPCRLSKTSRAAAATKCSHSTSTTI